MAHASVCTEWSTKGPVRHRSTVHGYAAPEIADDLALRVLIKLEAMRHERGLRPEQVVLCGVDNSTTAFAMAVLRLLPADARYLFCSGKKAGAEDHETWCEGCGDCDHCCGSIDTYGYPDNGLWVVIDDDICQGRAVRTVARWQHVHWFGINMLLEDSVDWDCDATPAWLPNATLHWWGASSFGGMDIGDEPTYQWEDGDDLLRRMLQLHKPDEYEERYGHDDDA